MGQPMTCAECNGLIKVTIEPRELIKLAVFTCRKCGIRYDTHIDYNNKEREGDNGSVKIIRART
jgi:transcription elongation factor Elf1